MADAVDAAGGLTGEADPAGLNLARAVVDGEQLFVPRPGESPPAAPGAQAVPGAGGTAVPGAPAGAGAAAAPGSEAAAPGGPVDLNTAGVTELDALPGIGPVLAQRIVEYRETGGGYRSVDDLAEVSGIGDAVLEKVRPLVVVS